MNNTTGDTYGIVASNLIELIEKGKYAISYQAYWDEE